MFQGCSQAWWLHMQPFELNFEKCGNRAGINCIMWLRASGTRYVPSSNTSFDPFSGNLRHGLLSVFPAQSPARRPGRPKALMELPLSACQAFVRLFEGVETGCPWPVQLSRGLVNSLAKQQNTQTVDQFRPVTAG